MTKARLEEVIIVESNRGLGQDANDPVRKVTSIFRKDGTLLAEIEPQAKNDTNQFDLIGFMGKQTKLPEIKPFPEQ